MWPAIAAYAAIAGELASTALPFLSMLAEWLRIIRRHLVGEGLVVVGREVSLTLGIPPKLEFKQTWQRL